MSSDSLEAYMAPPGDMRRVLKRSLLALTQETCFITFYIMQKKHWCSCTECRWQNGPWSWWCAKHLSLRCARWQPVRRTPQLESKVSTAFRTACHAQEPSEESSKGFATWRGKALEKRKGEDLQTHWAIRRPGGDCPACPNTTDQLPLKKDAIKRLAVGTLIYISHFNSAD